ncbi:MAG: CRTAC1 family protein [Terriglobales bacterium]
MRLSRVLSSFVLLALATLALAAGSAGPIRFEEIAVHSGLIFTTHSSPTPNKNQPETMVGGVGIIDYDNDGFPDIFLVNGAAIPSLQKDDPKFKNRLFHNNGDLTFTDVTDKAGVGGVGFGMGVAIGDYDNDGNPDIFVANVTGNQLLHNNGDGTFTDVTAKAGVGGAMYKGKKMWSVAAAWLDYNNDGLLDLFVSNYVQWEVNHDPVCLAGKVRSYCNPTFYEPQPNTLYRNNGDGTFTDVSEETGVSKSLGKGMGVAVADFDGDGYPDIFVANDKSPNFLFHNIGGKRFEEIGTAAGVAYSNDGKAISGMGVDFRDVNNDGRPDIWYTALEKETFPLLINQGGGAFDDATVRSGVGWESMKMSGWSNGIFDLDNDGWKDLFVARGHVLDNSQEVLSWPYPQPNSILRNLGNGKFEDVSAGAGADFQIPQVHRGAAFADFDNDGRMDVVVSVLNGQVELFHNVTQNSNHWILLQLHGTKSNRMGIGARIRLTEEDGSRQYNHVTTSVGYSSSSDSRVHFGLGKSKAAREIEVLWPSGIRQVLYDVQGDRVVSLQEPAASAASAAK